MDDFFQPEEAQPLSPLAPHADLPSGFVIMHWLMQPNGMCISFNRPEMIVGRHSQADVRLVLPDVSRRHCRVLFEDGQWLVVNLNSLNGVFVNGEKVQEAMLHHGDHLRLAGLNFAVAIESPAAGVVRSILNVLPMPDETLEQRRKAS